MQITETISSEVRLPRNRIHPPHGLAWFNPDFDLTDENIDKNIDDRFLGSFVDREWSYNLQVDRMETRITITLSKKTIGMPNASVREIQNSKRHVLIGSIMISHSNLPVVFFMTLSTCLPFGAQEKVETSTEAKGSTNRTPEKVAVENVADDKKIEMRLTGIFESTGWFPEMEVNSENGFVKLNGTADSDTHSEWATEIASKTKDVIGVSNQLKVDTGLNIRESMAVVGRSLDKQYREMLVQLPFLLAGLLVLVLTWIVSKAIGFLLARLVDSRDSLRASLKDLIKQLSSITIWLLGILLATVVVFPGMTPAKALTVLGLGSVAIGFAFKDIFENFFAGVLILWRYPIEKGDFIECGDVLGKVEDITIRNTMLRRTNGELVVMPNAQIFKSNVDVLTNRPKRRVQLTCGIGYGERVEEARKVIQQAVQDCQTVSGPKSVEIFANEFADSSVNFEIAWWTGATPQEVRQSRDEVISAVKRALDTAGIEIPFPQRTL